MKKHLLFYYSSTVQMFLLATFLALRFGPVNSAYSPNDHFTASVTLAEGVSEDSIMAHKVQRQSASCHNQQRHGCVIIQLLKL